MPSTRSYAAQNATSPLASWTINRRTPKPYDVEIAILYCGVCHSDLHTVRNEWGGTIYPCVPGHEIVGRVTAVGTDATKFKVGDLAAVGCMVDSCRECDNCKDGLEQYCSNGMVGTYNGQEKDGSGHTYGGYSKNILGHEDFLLGIFDK